MDYIKHYTLISKILTAVIIFVFSILLLILFVDAYELEMTQECEGCMILQYLKPGMGEYR